MERNPYAPPAAPIADIPSDPFGANPEVVFACKLLWLQYGISLLGTAYDVFRPSVPSQVISQLIGGSVGMAVGFAITRWVVSKLKAGKKWMRSLATIFLALGFLLIAIFWKRYYLLVYAKDPIEAIFAVPQFFLNAWAIVLLYLPRSLAHFSATKAA